MPITSPASYLPTTDEFIAHWKAANAALPPATPIILAAAASVTSLQTLRDTLATQRAAVEAQRNNLEGARADIEILKAALLERLNQFNGKVPSLAPASRWVTMLPKAYSRTDSSGKVLPVLDELDSLWASYDLENPALALMNGYDRPAFQAQLTALKIAYTSYTAAAIDLGLARASRNETQDSIRPILVQYRQRIPSEFPAGSPILATLPAYSPPDNDRQPDAVKLSGTFNPTTLEADLTWPPITDPDVTAVEIRATIGADYEREDENVLATLSPTAPPRWSGNYGLDRPGTAATYVFYTKTASGTEQSSNPITIFRPADPL